MTTALAGRQSAIILVDDIDAGIRTVNAYAAEGRRLARFSLNAHTPGRLAVRPEERNPNFPFTLDLRR